MKDKIHGTEYYKDNRLVYRNLIKRYGKNNHLIIRNEIANEWCKLVDSNNSPIIGIKVKPENRQDSNLGYDIDKTLENVSVSKPSNYLLTKCTN